MPQAPEILFVVDGGPEIGGGHVMRSLALARALQAQGARCRYVAAPFTARILETYAPGEFDAEPAKSESPDCLVEDASAAIGRVAPQAIVFDHFRLGDDDHRRIARGRLSLAIDDLADRRLGVDLVLDLGPDRKPEDYAGLAEGAELLLGPRYALLRPEFAQGRAQALARRDGRASVGRILVSLGLTDVGGITGRVVGALLSTRGSAAIDVVIGPAAPSRAELESLAEAEASLHLHVDSRDVAGLMTRADVAVGAGGSSTWERCALGLPSLLVVLADNQEPSAEALARLGAVVKLDARVPGFEAELQTQFARLMADSEARASLSRISSTLADGEGASRVAQALLARL